MQRNILIVEDEALIALEMSCEISDLGHKCIGIADDVESATSLASEAVDIALVDINLKDGATGPEIGEYLAKNYGIKVIFVTANPDQLGDGVAGTVGVIAKPIDVNVLKSLLDFLIAKDGDEHVDAPRGLKLFNTFG